jgi:hypothetical protein
MNRPLQNSLLVNAAGSTLRSRTASATFQLRYAILLFLFLVIPGLLPHANAAQANSNDSDRPEDGRLKIWVPAGIVGDDYWIYLNGSIVRSPPRVPTDRRRRDIMTDQTGNQNVGRGDGWVIEAQGYRLEIHHEDYDNDFHLPDDCDMKRGGTGCYLSAASGDTQHLFQAFQLSLPPGKYTVEIAMLPVEQARGNSGYSSFPFVITRKHVVDVRPDDKTQLDVGVPDDWIDSPRGGPLLPVFCPDSPYPPNGYYVDRLRGYMDDPIVKALQYVADESSQGVVVLHLPQAQGGEREFDGKQITYIADAIAHLYRHASHREVEECRSKFPEFAPAYTEYDELISVVDNDIARFRKLAANLERSQ